MVQAWHAPLAAMLSARVSFPVGGSITEQIVLRWLHFFSGIVWLGFLYFLNIVITPGMKALEPPVRARAFTALMPQAMGWLRWSALGAWLAGFRYFMILAKEDAVNAGDPALLGKWLGIWFGVWIVAYVLLHGLLMMSEGAMKNGWTLAIASTVVVAGASWLVLTLIAGPATGNRTLSISIGGGLGTLMLFLVWGMVWRCQKRLIAWNRAAVQQGTPPPPEAAVLARRAYLASRLGFWLSFPLLFFMAASAHYPFLSGN
ncbi:MAG TPA: urate hydroxylase PuuD [Candidatus Binatia bacterium]|nr:urate hydroxylase PuuD [Candidatus Binatia bacterium]